MLRNYIKTALKVFQRKKFFTFISLFGISFTLMILTVVTAFFDHIFGPLPPERKADRILTVSMLGGEGPKRGNTWNGSIDYPFLERYILTLPDVERVSASTHGFATLFQPVITYSQGQKIQSYLKYADAAFWEILDFDFLEGGPFTAQDEARLVAVINETTRRKFFGQQAAVGKVIELEGRRFRVVGVVANVPILRFLSFADIWVPIGTRQQTLLKNHPVIGDYQALILARKPSDIPRIKAAFQDVLSRVDLPGIKSVSGGADTLFETVSRILFSGTKLKRSYPERLFFTIVVPMILFMLLPTISLVNINVSRIMERASEIGVRKAFGASSLTLVGQFVVENIVLAMLGGLIGLGLSAFVFLLLNESNMFQYAQFSINYRVFLYGLLLALFFGVLSGVYPAWKMSRLHPVEALRRRIQ